MTTVSQRIGGGHHDNDDQHSCRRDSDPATSSTTEGDDTGSPTSFDAPDRRGRSPSTVLVGPSRSAAVPSTSGAARPCETRRPGNRSIVARRRSSVRNDERDMTTTINPVVHYRDLDAGARFLVETFGFVQHAAHKADDGSIQYVELSLERCTARARAPHRGLDVRHRPGRRLHLPRRGRQHARTSASLPVPRSSWRRPTRTTAPATSWPRTTRATCGASAPTTPRAEAGRGPHRADCPVARSQQSPAPNGLWFGHMSTYGAADARRYVQEGAHRGPGRSRCHACVRGCEPLDVPAEEFRAQVPPWVPLNADLVVLASGVVEIALGGGLLSTWIQPRRATLGAVVAVFFVAVFPGTSPSSPSGATPSASTAT